MKITINHDVIRALLLCAPKSDLRYYLIGVCVDARASGDVTLVATDGHRMLAVPVPADAIEALAPGQYIIPRAAIEAVKPAKAGRTVLPITIEIDVAHKLENKITGATSTVTPLIDGKYPDWRRVMPAKSNGELAQFNGHYMSDFHTIAGLLTGSKSPMAPVIHHNGAGHALVTHLGADALGVIMPVRYDGDDMAHPALPAWTVA